MKRKQISNLKNVLKDIEPYVKDPQFLTQGKRFKNFDMLVREAWANFLLCVVLNEITNHDYTYREDPGGDGIIFNKTDKTSFFVEHVCAMDFPAGKKLPAGEDRVIWAIDHKIKRGKDYAKDKSLVVFFDGAGWFRRDKIRENIYHRHDFKVIFIIGLLDTNSGYSYSVTEYRNSFGDKSITHKVSINDDFTDWSVEQVKE
jgi:hypothetical protein